MNSLRWLCCVLLVWLQSVAWAEPLNFSIQIVNGKHRQVVKELIREFEAGHPGTTVRLTELDNADYNKFMGDGAYAAQDVVWYFAGYQLKDLVALGAVMPLDGVFNTTLGTSPFSNSLHAVTEQNKVFALPISYYHWGLYYMRDVFEKHNLKEPKTWSEFEAICANLKALGIAPLAISVKENWTAAAWFDYLNLRMNGLDFHTALLGGRESFTDARVRAVFERWKRLIDLGYFSIDTVSADWRAVLPNMYRGKAAMSLLGNYMMVGVNPQYAGKIGFFRFPTVDPLVPSYEEAPTDVLFVTSTASHPKEAKQFIAFWSRPETLDKYNNAMGLLSPHSASKPEQNYLNDTGLMMLRQAKGFSQYFNRDTSKPMADKGFVTMGNFMREPDIDKTMQELERNRLQYLAPKVIK